MLFGRHVNKYYLKYSYLFIIGITALLFVNIYQLKVPDIIGSIIDAIDSETLTVEMLKGFIKDMLVIIAVMFTGRFLWRMCIFNAGVLIESDLRDKLFKHTRDLSQNFYSNNKTGSLMSYYTNDIRVLRRIFAMGTVMLIDCISLGSIALVKMSKLDWRLTLFSAIPLSIIAIMGSIAGKIMRKRFLASQQANEDLSDFAQENFSGLSVVKAFVKESIELNDFRKNIKNNEEKNIEFVKASLVFHSLNSVLIFTISTIIMGFGGYLVYQNKINNAGNFTIGNLTQFISYFSTLTWPMMAIGQLINLGSQGQAALKRLNVILDSQNDVCDSDDVIDTNLKGHSIEFNHLSFKYPGTENLVLDDISLKINEGEFVGVIGRTGSSKTTFIDLLLRLYNVEPGMIKIDGYDIMKLKIKDVRELIGYVPQDNFLFSDTLTNNIAFSSDEINDDLVKLAATHSDVDSNIMDFPEQYNTVLGERGVTLSGGQKQRVSIARALYKNPEILILDDSLSAVDTKTEETILTNLLSTRKGKMTIMIAHRISTVKNADKIIVLDEGKLSGFGTPDEMLETNEIYRELDKLQKLEALGGDSNA